MTKNVFYVKRGAELLWPSQYLFAAQLARVAMIDNGQGGEDMQIVDASGRVYPNSGF